MRRTPMEAWGLLVALVLAMAGPAAGQIQIRTAWAFETDAVHPGATMHAALEVEIAKPFHVHSDRPLDEFLIPTRLTVTPPEGITLRQVVYPEPILIDVQFSEEKLSVFEPRFVIGVALDVGPDVSPGDYTIEAALGYQACDDNVCLAPTSRAITSTLRVAPPGVPLEDLGHPVFGDLVFPAGTTPPDPEPPVISPPTPRDGPPDGPTIAPATDDCDVTAEIEGFTVLATAGGYLDVEDFLTFVEEAETGVAAAGLFDGKGPVAIVLLILLGGALLNLTPCVLPLVPINLGIIGAGAQASSRARGFLLGGAYGFAMAVVYGGLGLIVILTAGTFGSINSTIWFNVAIAILFVVLGLAMFDIILIDFSKFQAKFGFAGEGKRGSLALAFGMGAVTALLAGACVAPVVIQVIVYASDQYTRGMSLALGLPFFLGLGMALPWPLAGAGLSFLPRPGMWMMRVKQAFGVFILAFAAYYGYLAWGIFDATRVDRDLVAQASNEHLEEGWTASICAGLATARAEDKPVLVDMWATWCKNCLAMDKTTFKDPAVVARLDDYVKVKFQAEDLESTPARELLARFEGIGLPTYAILRPAVASATASAAGSEDP